MEDTSTNSATTSSRSSGFGPIAGNVPPPGQVVPSVGAMPTLSVPPVQSIADAEQSQPTIPTTVPPISSNVAQPVPPIGVGQGNGNSFSNGATHSNYFELDDQKIIKLEIYFTAFLKILRINFMFGA